LPLFESNLGQTAPHQEKRRFKVPLQKKKSHWAQNRGRTSRPTPHVRQMGRTELQPRLRDTARRGPAPPRFRLRPTTAPAPPRSTSGSAPSSFGPRSASGPVPAATGRSRQGSLRAVRAKINLFPVAVRPRAVVGAKIKSVAASPAPRLAPRPRRRKARRRHHGKS
jgi:hypothetical protein